ncbi:MAG: methylmalonyl-CoA epimerase [Conexivisphaerales archaeon]
MSDSLISRKLDHIGIAVRNVDVASKTYALLGFPLISKEEVPEEGVKIAMLKAGETRIELLEPLNSNSVIAKFLEKRGEGIHHIAFLYDDVKSAGRQASARGFHLIYSEPRLIPGRREINFIHPGSTHGVLFELVKRLKTET